MSIMGPLMMNAVRERAAAQPGRQQHPLFVAVYRAELLAHMQHTALRMLAPDGDARRGPLAMTHRPAPPPTPPRRDRRDRRSRPRRRRVPQADDPNRLRASGHVEATDVRLAPEVGGRILTFDVKEGDRIEAGARILTLDTADIDLAIDRARTEQASAEAQLRLVRVAARPEDVRQARGPGRSAARADVASAQAEVATADADLKRYELLLERKSGAQKQRDDAATRLDVAKARLDAATSGGSRPRKRPSSGCQRRRQARRDRRGAGPRRHRATPPSPHSTSSSSDTTLIAPVAGIVTEKLAEAGEVVAAARRRSWSSPTSITPGPTSTSPSRRCRGSRWARPPCSTPTPAATASPARSPTSRPRPSSRRATCRRPRSAPSSSTASAISADNTAGVLKQGMPVDAELALAPWPRGARRASAPSHDRARPPPRHPVAVRATRPAIALTGVTKRYDAVTALTASPSRSAAARCSA